MHRGTEDPTGNFADETGALGNKALRKMFDLIERSNQECNKLYKLAVNNQNTRKDIKESVSILSDLLSQLSAADLAKELTTSNGKNKNIETSEAATQTLPPSNKTVKDGITSEVIKAVQNYEDFLAIYNTNWPQGTYARSIHVEGKITQASKAEDVLLWDEGEGAGHQTKMAMAKYPDLEEKKGEYAQLLLTTRMRDSEGKESVSEQFVTKLVTDGSRSHCYKQLEAVRADMSKHGREVVAIYPPGSDDNGEMVRKMTECIFANT